ncbi:MAG: glycosyltransferase, partial [Ilumatobacteraceae bacterium]
MGRAREWMAKAKVAPARTRALGRSLAALRATERAAGPIDDQLATLQWRIDALTAEVQRLSASAAAVATATAVAATAVAAAAPATDPARDAALIALWTAHAPLAHHPLVSVVIPTHLPSRLGRLRSAIDSVLAQSYSHWELLVVDNSPDGMLQPLPAWWPADARVRVLTSTPNDGATARNLGVRQASGELIAYLDDDCTWFPWWMRSAVVALASDPAAAFAYGLRVTGGTGLTPRWVHAEPLTPLSLHLANPVDTNVLVHRSDVAASWPSHLPSAQDYDLIVQLSSMPHVVVPVPACAYGTDDPTRIWADGTDHTAEVAHVRATARARRPLRVVAANGLYPLVTETYIGDELEGLRQVGVDVALARQFDGPSPCDNTVDARLFDTLQAAIEAHDPDVVLCHWAETAADWAAPIATAAGVPHAVRLHSFCSGRGTESIMTEWCVGTWSLPGAERGHAHDHVLPTMVRTPPVPSDDTRRSRRLLSVSAGLPKKDFPRLLAAVELADVELDLILGTTRGWEEIPTLLREMAAASPARPTVEVDVPHADVLARFATVGAMVYSIAPEHPLGQPRSVLEGALTATPLVLPDLAPMRAIAGDTAHYYTVGDVGLMAAAIRAAIDQPHPLTDRLTLAASLRAAHSGAAHFERFRDELTAEVVRWQAQRAADPVAAAARWWG